MDAPSADAGDSYNRHHPFSGSSGYQEYSQMPQDDTSATQGKELDISGGSISNSHGDHSPGGKWQPFDGILEPSIGRTTRAIHGDFPPSSLDSTSVVPPSPPRCRHVCNNCGSNDIRLCTAATPSPMSSQYRNSLHRPMFCDNNQPGSFNSSENGTRSYPFDAASTRPQDAILHSTVFEDRSYMRVPDPPAAGKFAQISQMESRYVPSDTNDWTDNLALVGANAFLSQITRNRGEGSSSNCGTSKTRHTQVVDRTGYEEPLGDQDMVTPAVGSHNSSKLPISSSFVSPSYLKAHPYNPQIADNAHTRRASGRQLDVPVTAGFSQKPLPGWPEESLPGRKYHPSYGYTQEASVQFGPEGQGHQDIRFSVGQVPGNFPFSDRPGPQLGIPNQESEIIGRPEHHLAVAVFGRSSGHAKRRYTEEEKKVISSKRGKVCRICKGRKVKCPHVPREESEPLPQTPLEAAGPSGLQSEYSLGHSLPISTGPFTPASSDHERRRYKKLAPTPSTTTMASQTSAGPRSPGSPVADPSTRPLDINTPLAGVGAHAGQSQHVVNPANLETELNSM